MNRRNTGNGRTSDPLPIATARKIKLMIVEREMKPGDRLPTETELAEQFNVSRSTLREAMKYLRAENVVEICQGRGTFVNSDAGVGEDPLGLHFANQKNLLRNLFETRIMIEPQIAGLAAQRATPQDVRNLEALVNRMEELFVNTTEMAELDVRFHAAVAECTHNDVLVRVVPIINDAIRRSHSGTKDNIESLRRAKRSHVAIYRAIAAGDYMESRYVTERHIRETMDDIRSALSDDRAGA